MTYQIASNGSIHAEPCEHANRVRTLSGGYVTIARATEIAEMDFDDRVKVAPCATKLSRKQSAERRYDR